MRPIRAPSPSFDARRAPPDMIVLHYTGMETGEAALARLTDRESKVSAHYLVEEDGRLFALVDEARRAWHAGLSCWQGVHDTNGRSIGIEIVNPGHTWGYRPFPAAQIATVIELVGDIRQRWTIEDALILGHSDVAPRRREDPGEFFPWAELAAAGHGLWVEPSPAPGPALGPGDAGLPVIVLRGALARLGYDLPVQGGFDDDLAQVVTAFQRHWLQTRIDGVADGDTRARLMALLKLVAT